MRSALAVWCCLFWMPHASAADSDSRAALALYAKDFDWQGAVLGPAADARNSKQEAAAAHTEELLASNRPTSIELTVVAELGSGGTREGPASDLSAIARLTLPGRRCDVADAGVAMRGSGRGLGGGGSRSTAFELHGWASVCLANEVTLPVSDESSDGDASVDSRSTRRVAGFPLRGRVATSLNATPSLAAARAFRRSAYSETSYELSVEGLRMSTRSLDRGLAFIFATLGERRQWDGWPGNERAFYEVAADFGFFRLFRHRPSAAMSDRAIDILAFNLLGQKLDSDAALIEFLPLRATGVGLGGDRLLFDASLGISGSGGTISVSSGSDDEATPDEVIISALPDVTTWTTRSGVSYGDQAGALGIGLARALSTNMDSQLVIENRRTLWAQLARGRFATRGEGFAGTAARYTKVDGEDEKVDVRHERFAGGYLTVDYNPRASLWLGLRAEALAVLSEDTPAGDPYVGTSLSVMATVSIRRTLWQRPCE